VGKFVRLVARWLGGREPRVVDYIAVAVIGAVLASLVVAATSGAGRNPKGSDAVSSAPSIGHTSSGTTTPVQTDAATTAPPPPAPAPSRTFHVPDENVSCSLQAGGARCSVAPLDLTFVLPRDRSSAYVVPGLSVPRDAGSEAAFGTRQTEGKIVCDIPLQSVPAGITCSDQATGHGFEASRVASRQKLY
jgi:hypothetical protein